MMHARTLHMDGDNFHQVDDIKTEVLRSLKLYVTYKGVVELRVLGYKKPDAILSGYYNDLEKLARDVVMLDRQATGFYFTLNEINPELLHRRMNRYETGRVITTTDQDVVRRRWLPIDVDVKRLSGISSTDEEHDCAIAKAMEVRSWLTSLGWPGSLLVDSGNGGQVAYRIDLPNDERSEQLIRRCLDAISLLWDDDRCHIDKSVTNASRIWKLPGTMACKGEDSPGRPHRRAGILEAPDNIDVVPIERLEALARLADEIEPKPPARPTTRRGLKVDAEKLLSYTGSRKLSARSVSNGTISKLDVCPWDTSHTRSAFIVEYDDGGATIGCPHNSCGGGKNRILELLDKYPDCRVKTKHTHPIQPAVGEMQSKDYHLSDAGNAERLVDRHGDKIRYCPQWGSWLVYDGQRWKRDETSQITTLAKETIRDAHEEALNIEDEYKRKRVITHLLSSEDHYKIRAMVSSAKSIQRIVVTQDRLDGDRMLLNVINGTIDLRTGQARDHDPKDLITQLAPVEYRQDADCPRFKGFLTRIFDGDAELVRFVQVAKGYSVTGMTGERCLFIEWGEGANGKSTLNNTIMHILGDYHKATQAETLFSKKNQDGIRNDLARLKGSRYVTTSESNQGRSLDEAMVKQITGDDPVLARFLHREFFEFQPEFKVWLSTNHKPIIRGTDSAIWSRIRLIPFEVQIPKKQQIQGLSEIFYREEASGILNWLVEGCLQWSASGLPPADAVMEATEDYRNDMDTLATFVGDTINECDNGYVSVADLYKAYEAWCSKNGEEPIKQRIFVSRLKEKGFRTEKKTGNVTYWAGIKLKRNPIETDDNSPDDNSPKPADITDKVIKLSSVTSNQGFIYNSTYREKPGKSITEDNYKAKTTPQHAELSSKGDDSQLSSMPQRDRLKLLTTAMRKISKEISSKSAPIGFICSMLIDRVDQNTIKEDLAYLLKIGEVVEVSPGHYKTKEGVA